MRGYAWFQVWKSPSALREGAAPPLPRNVRLPAKGERIGDRRGVRGLRTVEEACELGIAVAIPVVGPFLEVEHDRSGDEAEDRSGRRRHLVAGSRLGTRRNAV